MTLSLDTAYRSFGGEVEASSTPTICRLPDSRRHQLSATAPWFGWDRLADLANELGRALIKTDDRTLWIGLFGIEIEHILHAGDVFAIDLRDAPHVLVPGLQIIVGQTPTHGLTGDIVVLSKPDQLTCEKLQRPAGAACGRARTGRRDKQRLLFAGELTIRSGTWLFAECRLQVAKHKAPFGPVHGRAAHPDALCDLVVAGARIGRQQNLRSLELAHRILAAAQKRCEFGALGLAEFDPIAYIHPCLLV